MAAYAIRGGRVTVGFCVAVDDLSIGSRFAVLSFSRVVVSAVCELLLYWFVVRES